MVACHPGSTTVVALASTMTPGPLIENPGASCSRRYSGASRHWPAGLQPDVLLLVTTSGDLLDVTLRGDLARGLKVDAALAAAGWTETALEPWRPLLTVPHLVWLALWGLTAFMALLVAWIASHIEAEFPKSLGAGYTHGTLPLCEDYLRKYS